MATACLWIARVVGAAVVVVAGDGIVHTAALDVGLTNVRCTEIAVVADRGRMDAQSVIGIAVIVRAHVVIVTILGAGLAVSKGFSLTNDA